MSYLEFMINFMVMYTEYFTDFAWILTTVLGIGFEQDKVIEGFPDNEILIEEIPNKEVHYRLNGWDFELTLCHPRGAKITLQGVDFTTREFDDFRRIILYQNLYDYDETPMSDDFRKVIEQYYAIKNRGIHKPDLEDKAVAIITLNRAAARQLTARRKRGLHTAKRTTTAVQFPDNREKFFLAFGIVFG